ncbi:hypothetical protein AOE01nite_23070 [Acetobacter oeni]|uniref:Uncharacterized protein n=1 Tax=Acetobacter oeni TaxID=304077 RepID=A0A511XMA5_9PROT|nr:hypothetical protein [Acetobacter oeni]GEN64083.1 hypothetical protein AOE01nite_23070 [Acetobacter oeni]
MSLSLTPGQRAATTEAVALPDEIDPAAFISRKSYDTDPLINAPGKWQITPVIPSKKPSHFTEDQLLSV